MKIVYLKKNNCLYIKIFYYYCDVIYEHLSFTDTQKLLQSVHFNQ